MFEQVFLLETIKLICIPAFFVGVAVLMATRWRAGPSPGDRKYIYLMLIRACAWTIAGFSFLAGLVASPWGLMGVIPASLAVVIALIYARQASSQQYSMLILVGAAADRSIPLDTVFAAYGRERGGWMRRRTEAVVRLLTSGVPLPYALDEVQGVLPPEALPLIRVGYENGSLGASIRQALAARSACEPLAQSIIPKIGYICFFPAAAVSAMAFLTMRIIPQFEKIFNDFGCRLPWATRLLLGWCKASPPIWLLFVCFSAVSLMLFLYVGLRYIGSIRWDLPGMGYLMRRLDAAVLLEAISLAANRQRPLSDALVPLEQSHPKYRIRSRLKAVRDDMQAGRDEMESLHRHGLIGKTDLVVLWAAKRNGNLAWAAREAAASNRRCFIYRTQALVQLLFPPIILAYALLVVLIAVATFLPLANLIQGLVPA